MSMVFMDTTQKFSQLVLHILLSLLFVISTTMDIKYDIFKKIELICNLNMSVEGTF